MTLLPRLVRCGAPVNLWLAVEFASRARAALYRPVQGRHEQQAVDPGQHTTPGTFMVRLEMSRQEAMTARARAGAKDVRARGKSRQAVHSRVMRRFRRVRSCMSPVEVPSE